MNKGKKMIRKEIRKVAKHYGVSSTAINNMAYQEFSWNLVHLLQDRKV